MIKTVMKKLKSIILILLLLFASVLEAFATNSLQAGYVSEKVRISQFLCYYEELQSGEVTYKMLEKKFHDFCYLADSLLAISSATGKAASFFSENGIGELVLGEKSYLFVSKSRENEVKASAENYVLTESYNDPSFAIAFVCGDLHAKMPKPKAKNTLYALETKDNVAFEIEENNPIFFLPGGEAHYSPCFELEGKNYIGFFWSKSDAMATKKKLRENHSVACKVKAFPCDFKLINAAYFKRAHSATIRPNYTVTTNYSNLKRT